MSKKAKNTAKCPTCKMTFTKGHHNQHYCCDECARAMARAHARERDKAKAEKAKAKKKKKKEMSELARINQLARAAGMSYGRYVELETRAKVKVERRTV